MLPNEQKKSRLFLSLNIRNDKLNSTVKYKLCELLKTSLFRFCILYLWDSCRQGCVSTRLDLEGINFHRYNMISGKESYFMNAIPAQKLRKPWKCQYLATEFSLSLRIWKGERD